MAHLKNYVWLAVASLALALAGCSSESSTSPTPVEVAPAKPAVESASKELTLSDVMRNAHFAFRAGTVGYSGGHDTYTASVTAQRVELLPAQTESKTQSPKALQLNTSFIAGTSAGSAEPALRGGSLVVDRGVAVEVLENTADGLEQSWEFATRPALNGASLVVRVRAAGQEYIGETEHGLHFADTESGQGFRYGLATWIDAAGQRTTLIPKFSHGEITIEVPASVVEASGFPAVLDPTIAPEFGMDNVVYVPAPSEQMYPVVECSPSGCLAAWYDRRSDSERVVATRIDHAGNPLEPWGIQLTDSAAYSTLVPSVATDGTNFVVAWSAASVVYAARVSGGGATMDPSPIRIETGADQPNVAFDGTNYLIVYRRLDRVCGRRLTTDGVVLDVSPILIGSAAHDQRFPTVSFNGTNYFVAWQDHRSQSSWHYRDVYGTRVSPDGSVLEPGGTFLANMEIPRDPPDSASDGVNYFVVWNRNCETCSPTNVGGMHGIRVGANPPCQ